MHVHLAGCRTRRALASPRVLRSRRLTRIQTQRRSDGTRRSSVQNTYGKKILVLPGFLSGSAAYLEMAKILNEKGYDADVLEISKSEWFPTLIGGTFDWYVKRLVNQIDILQQTQSHLTLVAHSASGWIARICLGSIPYMGMECRCSSKVQKLITLGTPHLSKEEYPFGKFKENVFSTDAHNSAAGQWSSSLQFANDLYGDAAKLSPVEIVTVIGSGFYGRNLSFGKRLRYLLTQGSVPDEARLEDFAFASYKANCGSTDADGDGVCPVQTALLPGAEHVILPHIFHGPNRYGLPWYGCRNGISRWCQYLDEKN